MKMGLIRSRKHSVLLFQEVQSLTGLELHTAMQPGVIHYLNIEENRLQLVLNIKKSPKPIEVDFLSSEWKFRIKTFGKSQLIYKAVGLNKEPLHILDGTAGLGQDSFCFLLQKCRVTAIEKNQIVYLLLKNGFDRLFEDKKWSKISDNLQIHHTDTVDFLKNSNSRYDVIYLDPMYADQEGKAKPKKEMEVLRDLVPHSSDPQYLLSIAREYAKNRVVIKRPIHARHLNPEPTHSFEGRSTRYDMYLNK